MDLTDRYRGALLGLASGDALGTTLEFELPGSFDPIDDMVGGGPFGLHPGEWTDDTSMALCLAESLIERLGFDANDQMQRYLRWWRQGYLSSNGHCFDIGITVRGALRDYEVHGKPFAGATHPRSAGNGSLMRLAPIPMAYRLLDDLRWQAAAASSATTHGTRACLDACGYYSEVIVRALAGETKAAILDPDRVPQQLTEPDASQAICAVAAGSYRDKAPPAIRGTGYVVESLEAALWAFYHSKDFAEGALLAVNLGDDADTTGAIYGQLAGAYYGASAIPQAWRERLVMRDKISDFADQLLALSASMDQAGCHSSMGLPSGS